jgi:internalin A
LVNRLKYGKFDPGEKETPGICITDWSLHCGLDEVKVHLWDFAGQEITHGTHQFFLSPRTIYLLLLTGREGYAERDADYWLRLIRTYSSDSPVLIVQNKIQQSPFELDESAIRRDHPLVRSFHPVDCESGLGCAELLKALKETIQSMDSVRKTFPAGWMKVKNRLSGMKENYLDLDQYSKLCAENGEKDPDSQAQLAGHLHNLGIILNYADDPRMQGALVLNPEWVTQGIYQIIRGVERAKSAGELRMSELESLLPDVKKPSMRRYLVDLMQKFELCFPLDEQKERFLVPTLLPVKSPELEDAWTTDKSALRLRFAYEVLPHGLFARFLVRSQVLQKDKSTLTMEVAWRYGVILLSFEGAQALARAVHVGKDYIDVTIRGPAEPVQRLAGVIRENLRGIHDNHRDLNPTLLVEVIGASGIFHRLSFLEELSTKRQSLIVDTEAGPLAVDASSVVSKVQPPEMTDAPKPVLRVFVSYSRKDLALKEQFDVNLKVLANQQKIIPWSDSRLAGGEDWNQEIEHALKAADIILFLVSNNFLASDYVRNNEMPLAIKRAEMKEAEVVPVILKDCGWQDEEWQKYGALPDPKKPIVEWENQEKAFYDVEKGLREVIKRMLADPKRKLRSVSSEGLL